MGLIKKNQFNINIAGKKQRVAILGFGAEGRALLEYLQKQGEYDITVIDDGNPEIDGFNGVKFVLKPGATTESLDYDLVWRASPSINPDKINTGAPVMTATQEFFARCPARIIGVTGTKGKGTTATLTSLILAKSGFKVHLVGNIGTVALSQLGKIKAEDIVVFELSSYQLWDLRQSPHVAVVLMISEDHLDVHGSMENYLDAKSNIARWQAPEDIVFYNPNNANSKRVASVGLGKKMPFMGPGAVEIKKGVVCFQDERIINVSEIKLIGKHNLENIAAAISASAALGAAPTAMRDAVAEFEGLDHRLQIAAKKGGVLYIDDSISTTPASTVAAIRAFSEPKVLILGGSDKGLNYNLLASEITNSNVKRVIISGENASKIIAALKRANYKHYVTAETMEKAVKLAAEAACTGDVVLLSPASASLDSFNNYAARGDAFKKAVSRL